jgi:hypothetical protein
MSALHPVASVMGVGANITAPLHGPLPTVDAPAALISFSDFRLMLCHSGFSP